MHIALWNIRGHAEVKAFKGQVNVTIFNPAGGKAMEYKGTPVSNGIACGEAFIYTPFKPVIVERTIESGEREAALSQYSELKAKTQTELEAIVERMKQIDEDKAEIFIAHCGILNDVAMDEEIQELITDSLMAPECAVDVIYEKYIQVLSSLDDPILKERADDIKDVKRRMMRIWFNVESLNLADMDRPSIIFAHDLLPSDTATLNRDMALAIVAEVGGSTSHSAILARSYGIPAVLGVEGIMSAVEQGAEVIVDAVEGIIITEPADGQKAEYAEKREQYTKYMNEVKKYIDIEPVMKDGKRVNVCLNIGSAEEGELAGEKYTDGVGLFRSEFLYMEGSELPDEETQYNSYKKAAETFGGREVILRTLDIGGDKTLEAMELPKEDNPFLGLRALRLCFEKKDIFKTQLRAALRAGVYGNLSIMLPMVGSVDDIRRAREIINEAKAELKAEGVEYNDGIRVGIMVEIPSIALAADLAAKEVDFASIGTNDLCQYLTAVDRLNPRVGQYYQSYHPSMFRLIGHVCDCFAKEGKPVSVCGEMGGDSLAAPALIGLGVNKLSMGISSVAQVKMVIASLTQAKAKEIADRVREMATAAEIEAYLKNEQKLLTL